MLSRLIIIGNGFDLAHGLHTKYSDFMEYLCSYEKEPEIICDRFVRLDSISPRDQEKHHFYEAISKYIPEQNLWSSFEEALSFLDYEQIQEDNSCYLLGYGDDNWRDSANHDFQYMIWLLQKIFHVTFQSGFYTLILMYRLLYHQIYSIETACF